MQSREELHKLIDSMPEGAIEAAHRTLSYLQVWPPTPPPDVQEMRRRMEERREVMQRQKPGTVAGSGGGNYDPAPRDRIFQLRPLGWGYVRDGNTTPSSRARAYGY
jgi:hypothetical protein